LTNATFLDNEITDTTNALNKITSPPPSPLGEGGIIFGNTSPERRRFS
jgi:hypothetical protein